MIARCAHRIGTAGKKTRGFDNLDAFLESFLSFSSSGGRGEVPLGTSLALTYLGVTIFIPKSCKLGTLKIKWKALTTKIERVPGPFPFNHLYITRSYFLNKKRFQVGVLRGKWLQITDSHTPDASYPDLQGAALESNQAFEKEVSKDVIEHETETSKLVIPLTSNCK